MQEVFTSDSVITFDEVIDTTKSTLTKSTSTKTVSTKNTVQNLNILIAFILIVLALLIAVNIQLAAKISSRTKQKLLPNHMSQITNKNKFNIDSLILKVGNKFTNTNIKKNGTCNFFNNIII